MFLPLTPYVTQGHDPAHVVSLQDEAGELSRKMHVAIEVAAPLRDHRVFLRPGTDPAVALRALAVATDSSVVKTSRGLELRRTEADVKALHARRAVWRAGWIRQRLLAVNRHAGQNSGDRALADAYRLEAEVWKGVLSGARQRADEIPANSLLPASVLLRGLVDRIGVEALAAIPAGETRVYEDAPVARARPLPRHDNLLATYVAAAERLAATDVGTMLKEVTEPVGIPSLFPGIPKDASSVARLRLQCFASDNGLQMSLEAYDARGRRIDVAAWYANSQAAFVSLAATMRLEADPASVPRVTLSDAARQAAEYTPNPAGSSPDWYRDPVEHEPLDLFVREAMEGLADREKASCFAFEVTDGMWNDVRGCTVKGRVDLDTLAKTMEAFAPCERVEGQGFVAWRPRDPEAADLGRADRRVLRRFAGEKPSVGFADQRRFARLYHDSSAMPGILTSVWDPLGGTFTSDGPTHLPPRVYALLGAISDPDWERLLAGGTATLGGLGVVREAITILDRPENVMSVDSPRSDITRHPWETLPSGDASGVSISLRAVNASLLRSWNTGKPEGASWNTPESAVDLLRIPAAFFHAFEDGQIVTRYTRERYEASLARYTFRRGKRTDLVVSLGLPQDLVLSAAVVGSATRDGESFRYADLPASVRDANWNQAVADAKTEARRRLAAQRVASGAAAP